MGKISLSCCDLSGLPALVNDIVIVSGTRVVPPGAVGEVWLRGPNIMKEYWNDPGTVLKTNL